MKYSQRLDYGRLAEVLNERGLAGLDAIRELLQLSQDGGMPFCEALVTSNLVSDWDLSKVVCETFQLPFLPLDLITPNEAVLEEVDLEIFSKHQLVPVDLFGQVLTVAMPGLVPAEVLAQVSAVTDFFILPMVGTVESNRRWMADHVSLGPSPDLEGGWESMFDEADASLSADGDGGLFGEGGDDEGGLLSAPELEESLEVAHDDEDEDTGDEGDLGGLDLGDLDLGEIEALPSDDLEVEPLEGSEGADGAEGGGGSGPSALPPMPDFGARDVG